MIWFAILPVRRSYALLDGSGRSRYSEIILFGSDPRRRVRRFSPRDLSKQYGPRSNLQLEEPRCRCREKTREYFYFKGRRRNVSNKSNYAINYSVRECVRVSPMYAGCTVYTSAERAICETTSGVEFD